MFQFVKQKAVANVCASFILIINIFLSHISFSPIALQNNFAHFLLQLTLPTLLWYSNVFVRYFFPPPHFSRFVAICITTCDLVNLQLTDTVFSVSCWSFVSFYLRFFFFFFFCFFYYTITMLFVFDSSLISFMLCALLWQVSAGFFIRSLFIIVAAFLPFLFR